MSEQDQKNMIAMLVYATEALEEIASEDFRGNRPSGVEKATHALKWLELMFEKRGSSDGQG